MTSVPRRADVVVVGGGIAGGALATVLSRAGVAVTVLERQVEYRDRVRGESLQPWGVRDAIALGLEEVLLGAGGHYAHLYARFGDGDPLHALHRARDLGRVIPSVRGALNIQHPDACEALMTAASAAGARCVRGVGALEVSGGNRPRVAFATDGGAEESIECRLVVGADGRQSSVRSQVGIRLRRDDPIHYIAGLRVTAAPGWPDQLNASATEGDVCCLVFPLGGGRHRLYACHAPADRRRFSGSDGASRFLSAFRLRCLPVSDLEHSVPAGPCASFPGENASAETPLVDGVVLCGDAAGYTNPLIGQGLAQTIRDVRVLSDALLSASDWSPLGLGDYCEERRERSRRIAFTASLHAELRATFGADADARRRRGLAKMAADRSLSAWSDIIFAGPESAPADAFSPAVRSELLERETASIV